jgi:3-oxoacyl-[acyl-carrier-protein] synthase III
MLSAMLEKQMNSHSHAVEPRGPEPIDSNVVTLCLEDWSINSTSQKIAVRLCTEGSSTFSIAAREHGFLLAPEQARQIIRDLSAAVLALDVKMSAKISDAK